MAASQHAQHRRGQLGQKPLGHLDVYVSIYICLVDACESRVFKVTAELQLDPHAAVGCYCLHVWEKGERTDAVGVWDCPTFPSPEPSPFLAAVAS